MGGGTVARGVEEMIEAGAEFERWKGEAMPYILKAIQSGTEGLRMMQKGMLEEFQLHAERCSGLDAAKFGKERKALVSALILPFV